MHSAEVWKNASSPTACFLNSRHYTLHTVYTVRIFAIRSFFSPHVEQNPPCFPAKTIYYLVTSRSINTFFFFFFNKSANFFQLFLSISYFIFFYLFTLIFPSKKKKFIVLKEIFIRSYVTIQN